MHGAARCAAFEQTRVRVRPCRKVSQCASVRCAPIHEHAEGPRNPDPREAGTVRCMTSMHYRRTPTNRIVSEARCPANALELSCERRDKPRISRTRHRRYGRPPPGRRPMAPIVSFSAPLGQISQGSCVPACVRKQPPTNATTPIIHSRACYRRRGGAIHHGSTSACG